MQRSRTQACQGVTLPRTECPIGVQVFITYYETAHFRYHQDHYQIGSTFDERHAQAGQNIKTIVVLDRLIFSKQNWLII